MIKSFLAALATVPFSIMPVSATGSFDEHTHLYNTVRSVGVRISINHSQHCDGGVSGLYISTRRHLVICQDHSRPGSPEGDWTANDLDTLRHEAHHLLQDCALGSLGDGALATWHRTPKQTYSFIEGAIGEHQARQYMNQPAYEGHNEERQLIEMEAFATAAVISPVDIAAAISKTCR